MSSFKFNFCGEDFNQKQLAETKVIQWLESAEVVPDKNLIENLNDTVAHAKMFTCGDVEIGHIGTEDALHSMGDNTLMGAVGLAEKEHSDLLIGTYEGGLKIWECTRDLIVYLSEQHENEIVLEGTKVLDLGCGAGILGIYAFINGSHVTFQDYNKEILECVTVPNMLLNIEVEDIKSEIAKCKFYSGDWRSFNKLLPQSEVYDLILTSETIYNPCNFDKLLDIFIQRLSNNGSVYLAAKTCYFGVGGGTRQFESCIRDTGLLKSEVCWKGSGGIQREILKITKLSS